jgi:hypothetical protein
MGGTIDVFWDLALEIFLKKPAENSSIAIGPTLRGLCGFVRCFNNPALKNGAHEFPSPETAKAPEFCR